MNDVTKDIGAQRLDDVRSQEQICRRLQHEIGKAPGGQRRGLALIDEGDRAATVSKDQGRRLAIVEGLRGGARDKAE